MTCECGLGETVEACCGRFISGDERPATAEQLMRSRYTAYTQKNIDYLYDTHDPKTRTNMDRADTEKWAEHANWIGLEVKEVDAGSENDDTGIVEFVANYTIGREPVSHHERSEFRKDGDQWFYVDGDIIKAKPVRRETPKVGRNEPCPCGSGKKFKKCCAAAA